MTEHLTIAGGTLAYDLSGEGPLVVLAHGLGDSRHSYRFLAPALVAAGYRVANVDLRGCGESSLGWDGYSRTDIAGDLVAVVRHLGGPAVIVGQSISGGAATIAAATAPELVAGVVELAPFTRQQSVDLAGLARNKRYRTGYLRLARAAIGGSVPAWTRYLDLAIPVKPADWGLELARIEATMKEPGRMKVFRAMGTSNPADADAQLPHLTRPVLVIEGSADPDWADPRAEGERILADVPAGLGELAVIEGAGHYPHVQNPDEVLALALPFLARTLTRA
ncbi:Pimeloyl-ACP methyl ester carboxylesterase [Friedmanniella luteola]|uniref:Pimeloyl-ACP methyl ester carboxylesterase n=1 Tax=Friedmanniella luteola TaxID=546871 RepID=A0A1H1ZKZ6_9ACTN|nr:alpha/beta hydrolase [Friedmanniella luteola]SDT34398.1 Pimeloyl-ACP methyl ester carboxylesterase [Friedmanniella luteola]